VRASSRRGTVGFVLVGVNLFFAAAIVGELRLGKLIVR
jgi:hypothetical protein